MCAPLPVVSATASLAPRPPCTSPSDDGCDPVAGAAGAAGAPVSVPSQSTIAPTASTSSDTKWAAFGYRCTDACGNRRSKSCRYRSENTLSAEPHSSSTGTSCSASSPAAMPVRAGQLGCDGSSGMSCTNSAIAARRSAPR